MKKYKTEEYVREDGKTVVIERCTNPHWDAMPGEFDKIYLYDPVKAEEAKDWEDMWSFKNRNGRRTWICIRIGIGMIIGGAIGEGLMIRVLSSFPPPDPAWACVPLFILIAGTIMIFARLMYVFRKQDPWKVLQCPYPEDPGAF